MGGVSSARSLSTTIGRPHPGWSPRLNRPRGAGRSQCERIPINCTVPTVTPQHAHEITTESGCRTTKVKVTDHLESLPKDLARVEAVRDALGPAGAIWVDANGVWDVDTAVKHIRELNWASAGSEYVEQACQSIEDLSAAASRSGLPLTSRSPRRVRWRRLAVRWRIVLRRSTRRRQDQPYYS